MTQGENPDFQTTDVSMRQGDAALLATGDLPRRFRWFWA